MDIFSIPAFGENKCIETRTGSGTRVFVLSNVADDAFDNYRKLLEESGFINKEEYSIGAHRFAAYKKDSDGVFLNYFESIRARE